MPAVAGALAAGSMSWRHAVIVADETDCLAPEGAEALVAHFFDPDAPNPARGSAPGDLVPHLFRRKVKTWRERSYPASVAIRHAKCVAERRMEYRPGADGMASITLILPGDTACAIWNKTTAIARGLQGPGETRTLTQLRPDVAAALLLSAHTGAAATGRSIDGQETGTGTHPYFVDLSTIPAPKADVLVTIPIFTMVGSTDEPADLDGYGPIPAAMARKLVADGATSFYRVLVDPRDGAPLEIGRTSYRLSEAMKRWIRMRDGHCTFPGCTNPSTDNDTDHLTAWQHHGTTGVSNLAQLCPKHHRLKHSSGWTPTPATRNEPPGWTSPTGRHYPAQHPDPQPPHWPPGILEGDFEGDFGGKSDAPPPVTPRADLPSVSRSVPTNPPIPTACRDQPPMSLEDQILSGNVVFPEFLMDGLPGDDEPPAEEAFDIADQYPDDPAWDDFCATHGLSDSPVVTTAGRWRS
ncbi:HNH endonuclease signature motif containing protein [Pseudarthrobacter equi]|uniref:HNH endonuclease signature motif containing protein n=1 Tax=Pseudarthrobacter equi TaxID=728066 RepID=UPI000A49AE13|nr:HNH endonuclease signature motif containing protein [Pseudarthrobacter equi]